MSDHEIDFTEDGSFDWGFTAVDEQELTAVTEARETVENIEDANENLEQRCCELEGRLDKVYGSILTLLENLKKNPEKNYILWPDRVEKVEAFETYLKKLYTGN